jgi:hypothetical protein
MALSDTDLKLLRQLCADGARRCVRRVARRTLRNDDAGAKEFGRIAALYETPQGELVRNSGNLDLVSVLKEIVRLSNLEQEQMDETPFPRRSSRD